MRIANAVWILTATIAIGGVTPVIAQSKLSICEAKCKSEYPRGKRWDKETALGACSTGCSKRHWSVSSRKAKDGCRKDFNPGAGHRDACIRGVDRWPKG